MRESYALPSNLQVARSGGWSFVSAGFLLSPGSSVMAFNINILRSVAQRAALSSALLRSNWPPPTFFYVSPPLSLPLVLSRSLSLTLSPLPPLSYGRNLAIYLSEWDKKLGRARTLQFEIVEIAQLFPIRASPSPSHEDDRDRGVGRSGAMA